VQKRRSLDRLQTEMKAVELEMSKATSEFQTSQQERQNLIAQWEGAISSLRRRDAELEQVSQVGLIPSRPSNVLLNTVI